jgi:dihydrofolate reductase
MESCRRPVTQTKTGFPHGGWLVPHADADMGKTMIEIFSKADAFLLGRTTYDIFSAYWDEQIFKPLCY